MKKHCMNRSLLVLLLIALLMALFMASASAGVPLSRPIHSITLSATSRTLGVVDGRINNSFDLKLNRVVYSNSKTNDDYGYPITPHLTFRCTRQDLMSVSAEKLIDGIPAVTILANDQGLTGSGYVELLANGKYYARCLVTIKDTAKLSVKSVSLSNTSKTLGYNDTGSINNSFDLKLKKAIYSDKKTHTIYGYPTGVTFSCAQTNLLDISETKYLNGVPYATITSTGEQAGSAYVEMRVNGKYYARCKVTVKDLAAQNVKSLTLSSTSKTIGSNSDLNNNTFRLSVSKVTYTDKKTHSTYGYPKNVTFVNEAGTPFTVSPIQYSATGAPYVDVTTSSGDLGSGYVNVLVNGKQFARCKVTVADLDALKVKSMSLSNTSKTLAYNNNKLSNDSFELSLKTVVYTNKKTHTSYGYPTGVTFVSADPGLVTVSSSTAYRNGKPYVTVTTNPLAKPGSTYVRAYVNGKYFAKCKVTVAEVIRASKIKLSNTSRTLEYSTLLGDPANPNETFDLVWTVSPPQATANDADLVVYSSSKPSIASVDAYGKVTARKAGTTYIYTKLQDGSKKYARCKVTVKKMAPTGITVNLDDAIDKGYQLDDGTLKMQPGQSTNLTYSLAPATVYNPGVTYSSSNKNVATVSSAGVIKVVGEGSAKIYAKPKAGSAVQTVTVKGDYKYRFYGIANGKYKYASDLDAYSNDIKAMNRTFDLARFEGGKVRRSYKTNLTGSGMRSYLSGISNNGAIEDEDVTIFYYSGHGWGYSSGQDNGAMCGVNTGYDPSALVTVNQLKGYLDQVPGKVIVVMDCCYSGAYITKSGIQMKTMSAQSMSAINESIISVFRSGGSSSGIQSKGLNISGDTNSKYHILTASAANQGSYAVGYPFGWYSIMTMFTQAGTYGFSAFSAPRFHADLNADKIITMQEIYQYTYDGTNEQIDYINSRIIDEDDKLSACDVQLWPVNDQMTFFAIN